MDTPVRSTTVGKRQVAQGETDLEGISIYAKMFLM